MAAQMIRPQTASRPGLATGQTAPAVAGMLGMRQAKFAISTVASSPAMEQLKRTAGRGHLSMHSAWYLPWQVQKTAG